MLPAQQIFEFVSITTSTRGQENIGEIKQIEENIVKSELIKEGVCKIEQIEENIICKIEQIEENICEIEQIEEDISRIEKIDKQLCETSTSRPIPVPHSFAKMPSHHKCAVKDCQDRISVRHRFPNPGKFITVFRQWINCIGNEAISHLEPVAVYNNYRVCHAHFTEDDTYTNNRLKKTAVPSVNLPEPQICQMVKANWSSIKLCNASSIANS